MVKNIIRFKSRDGQEMAAIQHDWGWQILTFDNADSEYIEL